MAGMELAVLGRFGVVGALLLLAGCSNAAEERRARRVQTLAPELLAGNDAFAWSLYERVRTEPGNLFFSPFSISTALGMTYAGARGQTAKEMHDVLHIDLDDAAFHSGLGALCRDLSGDRGRGYTLYVANRQFGQTGFALNASYVDLLRHDYGAGFEQLDFAADTEAARQHVNAWAESATHDTIPELFPQGSIDSLTRFVLANAIYFKASWAEAFDPGATKAQSFLRSDGSSVSVPMMRHRGEFVHTTDPLANVVELPYLDGEVSMLLVVPNADDGLPAVEDALPTGWLEDRVAALGDPFEVIVALPRFRTRWHASLEKPLSDLGMPTAFSDIGADFSGVADESLHLQSVEHSAFVEVDEHGTTAAAATGTSYQPTSAPMEIVADHPFLFVIRDRLTGSVLFVGRVEDPTDPGPG